MRTKTLPLTGMALALALAGCLGRTSPTEVDTTPPDGQQVTDAPSGAEPITIPQDEPASLPADGRTEAGIWVIAGSSSTIPGRQGERRTTYETDDSGNVTKMETADISGAVSTTTYEYDENGYRTSYHVSGSQGEGYEVAMENSPDAAGRLGMTSFVEKGRHTRQAYAYDGTGRLSSITTQSEPVGRADPTDSASAIRDYVASSTITYGDGLVTSRDISLDYLPESMADIHDTFTISHETDGNGHRRASLMAKGTEPNARAEYEINENGNIATLAVYDSDGDSSIMVTRYWYRYVPDPSPGARLYAQLACPTI